MIGLTVLALLCAWVWLAIKVGRWIASKLKASRWSPLVVIATVAAFLLLPVADELTSYPRFKALCDERMSLKVDAEKIRGRTVKHTFKQYYVRAAAIRVLQSDSTYADPESGEVLATYTWLRARGGWLSRSLTEGRNPITFGDNYECMPKLDKRIEETYQFNLIRN